MNHGDLLVDAVKRVVENDTALLELIKSVINRVIKLEEQVENLMNLQAEKKE